MAISEEPVLAVTPHADGCVISLTVSPRSSLNHVEIDTSGSIRIKLTASPVDGAANASLLRLLSTILDIPRRDLTILSGSQARHKRVLAQGIAPDAALRAILRAGSRNQ